MKKIFRNISLVMMTILVVFLSMGVNISKMQCDKAGRVFIGTETMSCSADKDIICDSNQEKITCCILEIKKSCCPKQTDNSCSSETELIQFDFEKLLRSQDVESRIQSHHRFLDLLEEAEKNHHKKLIVDPQMVYENIFLHFFQYCLKFQIIF